MPTEAPDEKCTLTQPPYLPNHRVMEITKDGKFGREAISYSGAFFCARPVEHSSA